MLSTCKFYVCSFLGGLRRCFTQQADIRMLLYEVL